MNIPYKYLDVKETLFSQAMIFTMALVALFCVPFSLTLTFVEVETVGEVY